MRFNDYKYFVFNMPNDNWARNEGFDLNQAASGTWFMGDRGSNRDDIAASRKPSELPIYAPQSAKDFYTANGYLNHEQAKLLAKTTEWVGEDYNNG